MASKGPIYSHGIGCFGCPNQGGWGTPSVNTPCIEDDAFKKKDIMACITLLSAMVDDLTIEFSMLESVKATCDKVKEKYGSISLEKHRALILSFENYMKKLKK